METGALSIMKKRTIRIEKPAVNGEYERRLWEEVGKYVRLISQSPDPNLGRVEEIKEEIKKGTYLTPEMVDEAAEKMAARFLRKL